MEKSTVSALIVAGAGVVGGVFQALVLRAARKKRLEEQEAGSQERRRRFDTDHGIEDADSD